MQLSVNLANQKTQLRDEEMPEVQCSRLLSGGKTLL